MLSTDNRIVKCEGEAQHWRKKKRKKEEDKRRKVCNFLKQNIVFEGDKSNTG